MNRVSILLILIFSVLTIQSSAQRKLKSPDLKAGISYPYVFGNTENNLEHNKITGFPSLSIEKPFAIEYKRRNRFSINPGLAYYFFKEDEVKGNILYSGGGSTGNDVVSQDIKLNHHSVSVYSKFLVQAKMQGKTTAFVYFGGLVGMHLVTKTKGSKTIKSNNAENPEDIINVNENSEDFYDPFYVAGVLGFQPNAKVTNFIKPSFEVKFYPGLLNRRELSNFNSEKMVEVSILLGFYQ
jgi:hypothetical protein